MPVPKLVLDAVGRAGNGTYQRYDQTAVTGAETPKVDVGHPGTKFILQRVANGARQVRIILEVQQHQACLPHELNRPARDDDGAHSPTTGSSAPNPKNAPAPSAASARTDVAASAKTCT